MMLDIIFCSFLGFAFCITLAKDQLSIIVTPIRVHPISSSDEITCTIEEDDNDYTN